MWWYSYRCMTFTGAPVNVPMSGSGGRDHMGEVIVAGKLHDIDLV